MNRDSLYALRSHVRRLKFRNVENKGKLKYTMCKEGEMEDSASAFR